MNAVTKVLYDVSQAVKELDKLNKKVDDSGKKAKKAFDTRSINDYDKRLKKLAFALGGTDFSAKGLLTTLGGSAAVFGAAAGGIASITANLLDMKTLLRDTSSNLQGFIDAVNKIRDARESISTFGDVARQRDIEFAKRAIKEDQIENARAQNAAERARNLARDRLEIVKDELSRREGLLRDAIARQESLQERLDRRTRQDAGSQFAGFDPDLQAAKLNQEARLAAQRGELDLAEELEAKAQAVAAEAKNQSFALGDAKNTRDSINNSIQRELEKSKLATAEAQSKVDEAKKYEDALEAVIDKENARLELLRQQSRELGAQAKAVKDLALEQRNQEQADSAARGVQTSAQGINEFIRGGLESGFESFNRAVEDLKQSVTGGTSDLAAVDTFSAAFIKSIQPILELTRKIQAGENVSAADIDAVQGDILTAAKFEAIIGKALQEGRVNENRVGQVEQFQAVLKEILNLNKEAANFRRTRGDDAAIREGSTGPSKDDMRAIRDALLNLPDRMAEKISAPSRASAAAAGSGAAQTSQGAPATRTTASNINVQANVKGGIIDEDVVKKITEIIRRELRKQTSQGTSSGSSS